MAQGKGIRKKKTDTSRGITRKDGKLFTCSICKAKRKTLTGINVHRRDDHGIKQTRSKKDPKTVSIGKMRKRGMLNNISEDELAGAIVIAKALRDPTRSREIARDLADEYHRRRKARGY